MPDSLMADGAECRVLAAAGRQLDAIVEHWFFEAFHGSLVARSTETWNHVHGAKEELKRRLEAFLADLTTD